MNWNHPVNVFTWRSFQSNLQRHIAFTLEFLHQIFPSHHIRANPCFMKSDMPTSIAIKERHSRRPHAPWSMERDKRRLETTVSRMICLLCYMWNASVNTKTQWPQCQDITDQLTDWPRPSHKLAWTLRDTAFNWPHGDSQVHKEGEGGTQTQTQTQTFIT
jgi:hypothetical protein